MEVGQFTDKRAYPETSHSKTRNRQATYGTPSPTSTTSLRGNQRSDVSKTWSALVSVGSRGLDLGAMFVRRCTKRCDACYISANQRRERTRDGL